MFNINTSIETNFANDEVYSVSAFLALLTQTLKTTVPMVWISGEISNVKKASSGHIYFSLKDSNSVIRCVLFRLSSKRVKFELTEGLEVLINASLNIYEARGDMQLVVTKVEPVGVGSIELQLKQLKEKLAKEGVFDIRHKKPIPKFPTSIGIITSRGGAVVEDIKRILAQRYSLVELYIYDVNTQGERAPMQIINALSIADTRAHDTLIIARGGGSIEDLYIFNDESLVRAVYWAQTPVISSIGHEVDTTLLDFVADYSAPTPSAAAVMSAPDSYELYTLVANCEQRLMHAINNRIAEYSKYFSLLERSILAPSFQYEQHTLERFSSHLYTAMMTKVAQWKERVRILHEALSTLNPILVLQDKEYLRKSFREKLERDVRTYIKHQEYIHDTLAQRLHSSISKSISDADGILTAHMLGLEHLSPLKVLSRGYSLTSKDNHTAAILDSTQLQVGESIRTRFNKGTCIATITKVDTQ